MAKTWRPGNDRRAAQHPAPQPHIGRGTPPERPRVLVVGGGVAGLTAAVGLAERGVDVMVLERQATLGGRARSWPIALPDGTPARASRGVHAIYRQNYNLRALLRRTDPGLERLRPVDGYPVTMPARAEAVQATKLRGQRNPLGLVSAHTDVLGALRTHPVAAWRLLRAEFPAAYRQWAGTTGADVLAELRLPEAAEGVVKNVAARTFGVEAEQIPGADLVGLLHAAFTGSAEGLAFDVPDPEPDEAFWAPLGNYLAGLGVAVETNADVFSIGAKDAGPVWLYTHAAERFQADAMVLAVGTKTLQRLVHGAPWLGDRAWRARIEALRPGPQSVVVRVWLDRRPAAQTPVFRAVTELGGLDALWRVDAIEDDARDFAESTGGSVWELQARLDPDAAPTDTAALAEALLAGLRRLVPSLADAEVVHQVVRTDTDGPAPIPWEQRPQVATPDRRVVLAGDLCRTDAPVTGLERAATTGWAAANELLAGWGRLGHETWSVPMRGVIPRLI